MGFAYWDEEVYIFTNQRFAEDFVSAEELQFQHKQGGIPPFILWAK